MQFTKYKEKNMKVNCITLYILSKLLNAWLQIKIKNYKKLNVIKAKKIYIYLQQAIFISADR